MDNTYFDMVFDKQDLSIQGLPKGDYENCRFINCLLAHADLSGINFSECEFRDCDLSLSNVSNTAFRTNIFKGCKLLGIQFGNCNEFLFAVEFDNCIMNHASFFRLRAKNTPFTNCSLVEADFTEADISGSILENCDLSGATFQDSILEKTDFRNARHYSIDPSRNRIKKAKFSIQGIIGLLDQHDIIIE